MTDVIKVSRADVERARLLVRLNESLDRPTSASIRRIAEAEPAARSGEGNGS